VPKEQVSSYGVLAPSGPIDDDGVIPVADLVEKPPIDEAPSDYILIGRYVLTPEIFAELERVQPGVGGEIQLTDAIAGLLHRQEVLGYTFSEGRYDTGVVLDYLKVIVEIAAGRDDLGPEFRAFLADFVARSTG
jgi:UTP--glucose-1-phosphate uridylyltransferase